MPVAKYWGLLPVKRYVPTVAETGDITVIVTEVGVVTLPFIVYW